MLYNYFQIALRSIKRNKLFTLINITGLSVGMGVAVMIFLYVEYETHFDRFHSKSDRIYRVVQEAVNSSEAESDGSVPFPIGAALRTEYPSVLLTRYFNDAVQDVSLGGQVFQVKNILYADSLFFEVFDYEWVRGSAAASLNHPASAVLTVSTAKTLFGDSDPMGKVLKLGGTRTLTVTGILADPPLQTSNPFSIIVPIGFLNREHMGFDYDSFSTTISGFECCVVLSEAETPEQYNRYLDQVIQKYSKKAGVDHRRYFVMPLLETHHQPSFSSINNTYTTSLTTIRIYILIGLLILGVGIVNFVNLATAMAMKRSREIGIRKAIGALKGDIFRQFMVETALITLFATLGGLIIAEIFLPHLGAFLGINGKLSVYASSMAVVFVPALALCVVVLTGFYPALILSGFSPIKALKGSAVKGKEKGVNLRSALVVFQFVISIVLIIATIVITRQMSYIQGKDLGFARERRLMVSLPLGASKHLPALRNDLMQHSEVIKVSFGIGGPASGRNMTTNFLMPGQSTDQEVRLNLKPCDTNYLAVTGLKMLAGTWFRMLPEISPDSLKKLPNHLRLAYDQFNVVVNRTATKAMGCSNPHDAIGMKIVISGHDATVKGVVEDFNLYSLHHPIMATAFFDSPSRFGTAIIHYGADSEAKVRQLAEQYWKNYFPDTFFSAQTYEDELKDYYEGEARTIGLVKFFSVIAILIGCMGLFGLVSFMVVRRTREIGIRKVLGASASAITLMIMRTFLVWIGVANLIAWPVAWYAMERWLNHFAFHVEFQWWIPVVAAVVSLLIGGITVVWHAARVALTNPVEAVRYE